MSGQYDLNTQRELETRLPGGPTAKENYCAELLLKALLEDAVKKGLDRMTVGEKKKEIPILNLKHLEESESLLVRIGGIVPMGGAKKKVDMLNKKKNRPRKKPAKKRIKK